mmetsp:Transcript_869/g.1755  ORF Transcript_869/g.1755 Transcript_869/m.1755 type:complete len:230 (-) Transcript_869:196-885(-)
MLSASEASRSICCTSASCRSGEWNLPKGRRLERSARSSAEACRSLSSCLRSSSNMSLRTTKSRRRCLSSKVWLYAVRTLSLALRSASLSSGANSMSAMSSSASSSHSTSNSPRKGMKPEKESAPSLGGTMVLDCAGAEEDASGAEEDAAGAEEDASGAEEDASGAATGCRRAFSAPLRASDGRNSSRCLVSDTISVLVLAATSGSVVDDSSWLSSFGCTSTCCALLERS